MGAINKEVMDGKTVVSVTSVTGTSWHLQYKTSGLNLSANKNYLAKFIAFADENYYIKLISQQANYPYDNLGLSESVYLSTTPQTFEIEYPPKSQGGPLMRPKNPPA